MDVKSGDPEACGGLEDFAVGGLKAMSADGGTDTVGDDGGARDIGLREEDREHFFGVTGGVVDGAQVSSEQDADGTKDRCPKVKAPLLTDTRVIVGEEQEQTERISVSLGASGFGLKEFVEVAVVE